MKKKRPLTLLELMMAIVLLQILLSSLFTIFYQTLKKNISSRELKQTVMQVELFGQKMKHLFTSEEGVWIDQHPEAVGHALLTQIEHKSDPDFAMCGNVQVMLFLNNKKQLCLVEWAKENNTRYQILLDKVDAFECMAFDPKQGEWDSHWPKSKKEESPMINMKLTWNGQKIPFAFFLKHSHEPIFYSEHP